MHNVMLNGKVACIIAHASCMQNRKQFLNAKKVTLFKEVILVKRAVERTHWVAFDRIQVAVHQFSDDVC